MSSSSIWCLTTCFQTMELSAFWHWALERADTWHFGALHT
eukprot:CAMPEP_0173384228 /NCGR_PEP_ID=MMETSP1356-20130122/6798_1 /TAXON_ID=77927 ORGANISM="Hemiselmis virescens, Strain PCC157" /NCGR_SAMPLE_ID=MMETSP1356 /ASSEMBLY_ACC=CAM_ASM_000847 /LENGTH=39 /DNA_ID= /DNA_START= /DNA_END= /DNA_ORIENTATION=